MVPPTAASNILVARRLQNMLGCAFVTKACARVSSFWSGTVQHFLDTPSETITGMLALAQIRHFRINETQQVRAWEASIAMLRAALAELPEACAWHVLLEYPMLRLGRRPDAIVLTDRAILVLEFKAGAHGFSQADRRQVEDYAIDLHDFHAASRRHPILPILVAEHAAAALAPLPMAIAGAASCVIDASAETLPHLLGLIAARLPRQSTPLDPAAWLAAPYRPVPNIVDAACLLYARHNVADIRAARSDAANLRATTDAILAEIAEARAANERVILFVTGIPGAGKTLCGLNTVFGTAEAARGTYLTGNPTLVHVLREALARDAVQFGAKRAVADHRMKTSIQRLPDFRNEYVTHPDHTPPEQIVVVDEAQRCWSRAHAIAKTRDKPIRLTASEPAHLLEAMSRHPGFAAMVCLVGGGQEIHDGEGGLAEWGDALRRAPRPWRVRAAPDILSAVDKRQRLGNLPGLLALPALHLGIAIRQVRSATAADWVNHVLAGDADQAAAVARADGAIPFHLTRSLADLRAWLRAHARGLRRAGLLASSGAKRLRAEGLGAELPHMDAAAVAHWFLDRFPDIRASDALETVATEFSCQGLELDYAGLCWDADLIREANRADWRVRQFRGTSWQIPKGEEAIANQINTYRVLLTRARYETAIFVPPGDAADPTRSPAILDGIASFLRTCGVRALALETAAVTTEREPVLL